MKSKLLLIGGFLMVLVCVLGLLWQQSFVWAVCPQALVVMFLRQPLHAYDSLGAADYPDIAVAVLYCPLSGWILSLAAARNKLRQVVVRVGIWRGAFIGVAVSAFAIRNRLWGLG